MRLFGKESFVGLILTTKKAVAAIVEWSIWVFFCLFASGSSLALISGRCSFDPRLHPLAGGARPIDRPCVGIHAPTVRTYVWGWVICGKMGPLSPERCFATKHPCNEPASRANGRTDGRTAAVAAAAAAAREGERWRRFKPSNGFLPRQTPSINHGKLRRRAAIVSATAVAAAAEKRTRFVTSR